MSEVPESVGEYNESEYRFPAAKDSSSRMNVMTETLITEEDESANLITSQINREMPTNCLSDLDEKSLLSRKSKYSDYSAKVSEFSDVPMV